MKRIEQEMISDMIICLFNYLFTRKKRSFFKIANEPSSMKLTVENSIFCNLIFVNKFQNAPYMNEINNKIHKNRKVSRKLTRMKYSSIKWNDIIENIMVINIISDASKIISLLFARRKHVNTIFSELTVIKIISW